MVTLAYIHCYVCPGAGNAQAWVNDTGQEYHCSVQTGDNTCAALILAIITTEQEEIIFYQTGRRKYVINSHYTMI